MAQANEIKAPAASKLMLVCALAMAASTFATDSAPSAAGVGREITKALSSVTEEEALSKVSVLIDMSDWMQRFFDDSYEQIIAGNVPDYLMGNHPFAMAAEILGRALREIRSLRGSGELGPRGDEMISGMAEARFKADRNANIIRQMTTVPKVYTSSINRTGLVAMAKLARDVTLISDR